MVPFAPTFLSGITTTQPSQPAVDPQSIAKQQADLQAKILSILNPGGGAKPASSVSTTQQSVLSGKSVGGATAPAVPTPAKPTALSTTAKPIFPLYPAQPKSAASSATGGFMSASGVAATATRAPAGATASRPASSTGANPVGKAYPAASPYGQTAASMAVKQAASYQFAKPITPAVQSTYTVGSNQAAVGAPSSSVYGSQAARPSQNYSTGTQAQSGKFGQPPQSAATAVSRSPIPVVSKFSPAGQAIGTVGASRPAVNSAPNVGRGTPTSVGGPRPASSTIAGQVRTPSPGVPKGRAGLLGASPTSGIATRALAPSGAVRAPTGTPGVRMGAPRGPSPVGRGTVRAPSPAGMQGRGAPARGGAVPVRGGAISVRGGATSGAGATRPPLASPGGTSLQTASPNRGALAQRGAPTVRGVPSRGGPTGATRGTPPSRGAPTPRGAPGPRGSPMPRGSPYMRGAPGGRGAPSPQGAPIRPVVRGGPGQGGAMNRGAPRGRSVMRGGPSFRGGRGNPGGYGGY